MNYVLLPISDSHTKCACIPAVHPHPWASGSCTALHQGASVSFAVTLVTGVITQEESKRGLFFPVKNRKAHSVARGELKLAAWKQETSRLRMIVCFAALFLFCPSYLLILVTPCKKWACCQRPFPTTHPSRSLQCHFVKNMDIRDPDGQVLDYKSVTSLLRHGWAVVVRKLPLRLS